VTIVLLTCSALLLGVILFRLQSGPPKIDATAPVTSGRTADLSVLGTTLFAFPPLEEFSEIVERPLFNDTRRPFEPPSPETVAASPPPPPAPPPRITLLGVVVTPETRSALLLDELRHQFIRASVGMSVSGWELSEVSPDGVTLRQGQMTRQLDLLDEDKKGSNRSSFQQRQRQVSQK